jgi:hypothetical protein
VVSAVPARVFARIIHGGFVATGGVVLSGAGETCKVVDNFFLVGSSHDCSSSLCHLILADGSLSDYQASGPVFSMLPVLLTIMARE